VRQATVTYLDGMLLLVDGHRGELACLQPRCGKTIRFSSPSSAQIERIARAHRCGNPDTTHWTDDGYM
jgi:hypothetical protein